MERVVVVGSGASGVHFAQTLLKRGRPVTMLDVGRPRPAPVEPEATLDGLKEKLPDPASYFLGDALEGVLLPDRGSEYYGIPPSKGYVFDPPPGFAHESSGFEPLSSFARGGLAEVWTGGSYPFNDDDLRAFPFGWTELEPHYVEVARRIGITGANDDLTGFLPVHGDLLPPLELDEHSRLLVDAYRRKRDRLNRRGFRFGRTRVATLPVDRDGRKACSYLGRCLWGCPNDALWTPSMTLDACRKDPNFTYVPDVEVLWFTATTGGTIESVVVRRMDDGRRETFPLDRLVLAAGTLGSARILLDSVRRQSGTVPTLEGLMDNRQVLVPFVNLRMIGRPFRSESYQYHQLGLVLETADPAEAMFGLVTTLKTALVHPIAQALPFDLGTSLAITRAMHAALGIVNLNFHDVRRPENQVTLAPSQGDGPSRLKIRYTPSPDEPGRLRTGLSRLRRALASLGCIVPPGMAHVRPMGASVHYAGTLPMARGGNAWTTTPECRSRMFENLWLVDGSTFPALPAKNLTFTMMANAVRVAERF